MKDSKPQLVVGVDLGDRFSHLHVLDFESGDDLERGRIATTRAAFEARFAKAPRMRVALETGTHSVWVARLLDELGHEVLVANARKVRLISDNDKKNDDLDAERLARLARVDPKLLHPVRPRGEVAQTALATLKARDTLVRTRTMLINTVRGLVKSAGARLPKCGADAFHRVVPEHVPAPLKEALLPLLAQIETTTTGIKEYDRQAETMADEEFPETELLRQVPGVGPVTGLAFRLIVEDPKRFSDRDKLGSYLGLCPRQDKSCSIDKQLRITKSGNTFMRRLLVTSAHYVIGPHGKESDLRTWGLKLAERGGKNGKKRAVVAVARKLAILLRHLWLTGQVYDPLHASKTARRSTEEVGVA